MTYPNVSMDLFQAALLGYERQKALLDERIAEIRGELGGGSGHSDEREKPTRGTSDATRRRMASARTRWSSVKTTAAPARRKISDAGRKRIIEATKKRWAAWRAARAKAR